MAQVHPSVEAPGRASRPRATSSVGRRSGYIVSVVVNVVGLWVVNHLLSWGWPPFLTSAFEDLLPYVNASIIAGIVANVVWTLWDPDWLRHLGQIAVDVISFVAVVRTWQIFPFDLSGYWGGWETIGRVVLVLAGIGLVVDVLGRLVALVRARPTRPGERSAA